MLSALHGDNVERILLLQLMGADCVDPFAFDQLCAKFVRGIENEFLVCSGIFCGVRAFVSLLDSILSQGGERNTLIFIFIYFASCLAWF